MDRKKYYQAGDVLDVLDVVDGGESDFDELSSSNEDEDFVPNVASNTTVGFAENDSDDSSSESDYSASSEKASAPNKETTPQKTTKTKPSYKFDARRPFIPPADTNFVDIDLQPEPTEGLTPYEYFKRFITSDMFSYLADESNIYAHQKSGINLQCTKTEMEVFTGIYFRMGFVNMPAVGCFWETDTRFWETDTRFGPVADMMARNRFQKLTSYLLASDEEKQDWAWKIRSWFEDLKSNFAIVSPEEF